jgi:hypothetical protein
VLLLFVLHRFCADLKESYIPVALLLSLFSHYLESTLYSITRFPIFSSSPVPVLSIPLACSIPYLWKKRHGRVLCTHP